MTRPLDPFDFDGEDDEDQATVLMSGHQRALLSEALRTPAPLEALILEHGTDEADAPPPAKVAAEAPVDDVGDRGSLWVVTICMAVLAVAVAMSSYAILVARP